METSPVNGSFLICSCLRVNLVWLTEAEIGISKARSGWEAHTIDTPEQFSYIRHWTCGQVGHYGLGALPLQVVRNYLGAPPAPNLLSLLVSMAYCAVRGWNSFERDSNVYIWFAVPPKTWTFQGVSQAVRVPVLCDPDFDWQSWAEPYYTQAGVVQTNLIVSQARDFMDEFQQLIPIMRQIIHLSATSGTAVGDLADALNALAQSSTLMQEQGKLLLNQFVNGIEPEGVLDGDAITGEAPPLVSKSLSANAGDAATVTSSAHGAGVAGVSGDTVIVDESTGTASMAPQSDLGTTDAWVSGTVSVDDGEVYYIPLDSSTDVIKETLESVAERLGFTEEEALDILKSHKIPMPPRIDETDLFRHQETDWIRLMIRVGGRMGKGSNIGWVDHTFNPWWGCYHCADGCQNCYAETMAHRWNYDIWGRYTERRLMRGHTWRQPILWDQDADFQRAAGRTSETYVLCGSMCDVFEDHALPEWAAALNGERERLWDLIEETPLLTWILLTKRPENIKDMLRAEWLMGGRPPNLWLGGSVSRNSDVQGICQPLYDLRYHHRIPYALSVEPMLERIDLGPHRPDWVIIGGETGSKARTFKAIWALNLIDDCQRKEIPVYMKQIGSVVAKSARLATGTGDDPADWIPGLRVRHFPGDKLVWPEKQIENPKEPELLQAHDEWAGLEI